MDFDRHKKSKIERTQKQIGWLDQPVKNWCDVQLELGEDRLVQISEWGESVPQAQRVSEDAAALRSKCS